jgi:hypothetical protein
VSELARPLAFTLSTITSKVVEYTQAERADTLALFLLYPLFVLCKPGQAEGVPRQRSIYVCLW